jgi:monoamine oxidase
MARSPLMRSLQHLARDHAQAGRLGIDVGELRQREAEAVMTRRDVLARGAALGAFALAGPGVFARRAGATAAPRIAVVGGGIAGLSCALALQDAGVACDVYEASSRLGGRMHSDWTEFGVGFWENGQQAELCGELIDSGHKTILHLAQRLGLATVDLLGAQPNGTEDTYFVFGSPYPKSQADIDFQPVHNTLQGQVQAAGYPTTYASSTAAGRALDSMTLYDWIEGYVPGGHASPLGAVLDNAYNEEYGADTTGQSALNLVYLLGYKAKPGNFSIYGASDERYRIVGGNSKLPLAIAAALPSVHTGYRMTSIRKNADGTVAITFDTGGGPSTTVTADHAVLCMSFSVLRTLDYSRAGFDQLKRTAIAQLGSGINAKLQLQFASRIWNAQGSDGSVYTDQGFQSGWESTRGQSGATGIFVDYPGRSSAAALGQSSPYTTTATNKNVTTLAKKFLTQVEPIFPGLGALWNGKAMLSTPFADPNLRCSYSYWKPGQYAGFSGYEGARQGNVHFAGEHCSQDFQGFMEGGAAEGVRAANEILADLK